jgi:hypothetical protein
MARTAATTKPPGPQMRAQLRALDEQHRRARGAALLDGVRFDATPLAAVRQELEALEDAEAEASRRQATAAEQARAGHVASVRERVATIDAARVAALGAAEQAAVQMVAALAEYRAGCAAITNETRGLGAAVPASLLPRAVDQRIGSMLAGALFEIRSDQYSLGELEWHRPMIAPVADWPAADRAQTAPDIETTIARNSRNG